VNYQRLTVSYDRIAPWVTAHPTLVVLDEAHRMKRGRDGEWGSACLDLAFLARRRDVLTGTPAPQHPSDLEAILDFLWPGQALRVLPREALVPQPSPADIARITPAISPLFVRATKHELKLAEPAKRVIRVPLAGLHEQIYGSLRAEFSSMVKTQRDRVDLSAWGNVVMYLLEAATNPALLPAGSSSSDPIQFRHPPLPVPADSSLRDLISDYAAYETPTKFVQLAGLVDQLRRDDRKVLIWSNFVRNLETLERMLAVHEPALVHGGIASELTQPRAARSREAEIARFRSDKACGVLLANPAAMGEGISLHQVCHDAVYVERTFNAGQYLQSVDRIHRLGLAPDIDTTIYFLVTERTIDEAVSARIELKATNLGIMLDDPSIATMALPDDDDVGDPIDVGDDGDIAALFAHLRGDSHEQ
jgi:SNF2 family DNA or RNA helicase